MRGRGSHDGRKNGGRRRSTECLMGSVGGYWSVRQWRLWVFFFIIQLFHHLLDVPAARIRALLPYTSRWGEPIKKWNEMKAMAPWEAARGSRVEKWKALAGLAKKSPKSVQFGGYHIFHLFFFFWLLCHIPPPRKWVRISLKGLEFSA